MKMDVLEIMKLLSHRYPFLLVDRVLELEEGKRLVAIKNVTINEPFFQGHFPGNPVKPGVLIIEGMAQAGAILAMVSDKIPVTAHTYFGGIDKARFRRPVRPGDVLQFELEMAGRRRSIYFISGKAYVENELVAEALLKASIAVAVAQ